MEEKNRDFEKNDAELSVKKTEKLPEKPLSAEEKLPETEAIEQLLQEKQYPRLREAVRAVPPTDFAEIFDELLPEYRTRLFRILPKEQAAEVFIEMSPEQQKTMIDGFTDRELSEVLDEMYLDDTVDLIEEMPANVVKRILRNSSSDDRHTINQLLKYPKDSAGTIMTTEYVRFTKGMTVGQALDHICKVAIDKETIYTCYVTDHDRHLLGIVTAKKLLLSPVETTLDRIMDENVIFAVTTDDKEDVAQKFDRYGLLAIPVVDRERRLVGIITVDDAIDVIHRETEEDFAKMAAITPTETTYLKTSAFSLWKARIPWLLLLMVSATFSSTILNHFEAALPAVLILFVPMLMDTGGNSGGQSSVTVIRGLSLGEVEFSDVFRVLWKELRAGIYCGLTLGVVAFGKVMLVDRLFMGNSEVTWIVALAVSVSLALTIVVAKLIGAALPLLACKIGFDPAVMASPFITTIVDAVSLLLYFFIAADIMHLG